MRDGHEAPATGATVVVKERPAGTTRPGPDLLDD